VSWALALFFIPSAQTAQGYPMREVRLSASMFRIASGSMAAANVLLFNGRDGILLVDSGEGLPGGQLEAAVKRHGPGTVKFIINTHLHDDHVGGNQALGKNATIIDFTSLARWSRQGVLLPGKGELKGKSGKEFPSYFRLPFNGEDIFIIPATGGHSEADVIVYFRGAAAVHLGDLLFSDSFPLLFGDLDRYQEILEKVLAVFPSGVKFVAGHGRDYSMAELKQYCQVIVDTRGIVEAGFQAGKSLQAVMASSILKKWDSYGNAFPLVTTGDWIAAVHQAFIRKGNKE
jgi:glyoxylase-like metal-dependent hydrolase (beta-lactamase superfamily II)